MNKTENLLREKYADPAKEEGRFTETRSAGEEAYYTKKILHEFIRPNSRVLEVGCATGHYALHFAAHCAEYVGLDIIPEQIALFQEKIKRNGLANVRALVGDATRLDGIADESFDVVCCLGPMYHLPPERRAQVFAQCHRVCKSGGIAAFAYISTLGVYAGGCALFGEEYPSALANQNLLLESRDDLRPDLFFFATPQEMEQTAAKQGFAKLKNLGTDFFVMARAINQMDDEKFALYRPLADALASDEACTGMSNHALLVCIKNQTELEESP